MWVMGGRGAAAAASEIETHTCSIPTYRVIPEARHV